MKTVLKENETMQDIVDRLVSSSKMVYDVAPMAYWYENLNSDGRIKDIHFSDHMREILGYRSKEEFPDELDTLMTFTHPDDVHIMFDNAVDAATRETDTYNVEYRIRNASGAYTWCRATGKVVTDHNGVTVGMYGAFIDISDKKAIDEHSVIESFTDEYDAAFFGNLSDRSYRVLSNKDAVADRIAGILTTGKALKAYVGQFVHPDDVHNFDGLFHGETVRKRIRIGQTVSFEYRSNTDGSFRWYRATLKRLNENDVLLGFRNCNREVIGRIADEKLLGGYDALYFVDLDRNEIEPLRNSRVSAEGVFEGTVAYDARVKEFAGTVAVKYRQDWISFSDPAYMRMYMAEKDHREYIYELPGAERMLRRFTVDVLERNGDEASKLLFSFIGIDDLRAKTILLNNQVAEQATFTNFFLDTYVSAYYIGFDDLSCKIYKRTDELSRDYPIITDYLDSLKKYIRRDVHPDDRKTLLDKVAPDRMRAILKEKREYTHIFRDISGGREKIYQMQVIRGADRNHAAFGFKDITEDVEKERAQHSLSDGLAREYHTVWLVDGFGDHLLHLYRSTGKKTVKKAVELGLRVPSYDVAMVTYINDSVHEDDRERVIEATRFETLVRETPDVGTYVVSYRRYNDEGKVDYHQMCFAKAVADDGTVNYILAYRDADKMLREQIAQQKRLEDALATAREEAERNDILHEIIHSGQWTFILNSRDEITKAEYSDKLGRIIDYDLPKEPNAWTTIVHPDDLEGALSAFNAAIADHSGKTPYDVVYRMINRHGEYHWFHSAGKVVRDAEGNGEFFGVHIDVTDNIEEQRRRLLGAVPLSPDILTKANIGMWAFELDEGCAPRMYDDETMLGLVGLDHPVSPEEAYHAWYDHIDKDSYDLVNDAVAKMVAGEHAEVQYPWHYPDGRTITVRCGGVRNWGYTKGVRIEGTHQDVTATLHFDEEQKKFERMKQSMNMFFTLSNEYDPIIVLEPESGEYNWYMSQADEVSINTSMTVHGENLYKNIGIDSASIIHEEDRDQFRAFYTRENMMKIARTGETQETENRWFLKLEGRYKWKYNKAVRMMDDSGKVLIVIGVIDTTEKKEREAALELERQQAQKQLQEALSMAQSANRAKTTFLNNMSHDIRTPMNAIIGYTGLAASHIDNKVQVQDYLSKIGQSSDHLLSLINDVLDMSRIESGKMNLNEKEENLSDIIHTLRDIVQADIRSKKHDFFIDTVNVHDEQVVCDRLRLNQVLLNILSNAIKYTAPGGTISMRIEETTVKPSGYATYQFRIKDNGMGMSKEYLKTIFDPFTRVKSSTVSGIQGTGLGMAITKNIVDMMGGKIEVKSELGRGTDILITFDFKLHSSQKRTETIPELKGLKGLVADDDSNTCLSIAKMLKDVGMKSEWCTSGKEAVIRAEAAYHDGDLFRVYIIDWMMPDMNGIETTRRIRKVIGDDVPIIIMTAYDWADIEEEATEAGVTAFVSKPMFPSDLNRIISKCLGKEEKEEHGTEKELNLEGKRILLVEDNELNREIATALLSEYGCRVFAAEDGDIAVEMMKKAREGDYDLILMDIQMPTMNGYEATRQIRALGTEVSKIPILAMTANAFDEDRKAALDAGMNEHIAKPIDIDKLKATLAKFL